MLEKYRGRFAPSPTGLLHFGSLIAATGSYLQAKSLQGDWLVRMEDLDPPREMPGAADAILRSLEAFGFEWDESVVYQSRRSDYYEAALTELARLGLSYPCGCSRRELREHAVYPGICRNGLPTGKAPRATRLHLQGGPIVFEDGLRGLVAQNIVDEVGDFVIKRADDFYAYQLAVVVDDADQRITEVVRGSDLLAVTTRQIYLQQVLGLPTPNYAHLPIAVNARGEKLSKQTFAKPLQDNRPAGQFWQALVFLGQQPPANLRRASLKEIWQWALANWQLSAVPTRAMCAPED